MNWNSRPVAPQGYTSVASGNSRFVALAPDRIDTSTNGIDWQTSDNTNGLNFVSFGFATNFLPSGVFVATGTNIVALSTNGSDWTYKTMPSNRLCSLVTPRELLLYRTGSILSSTNGDAWTTLKLTTGPSRPARLMAYGNGRAVAGDYGISSGLKLRTYVFSDAGFSQASLEGMGIPREIIFGAGTFVMSTTMGLFRSEDGLGWTLGATNTSVENPPMAHGYTRGWFSAFVPHQSMKISNDGKTWINTDFSSNPFEFFSESPRAQTSAFGSMFVLTDKGTILQSNPIVASPNLVLRVLSGQISLYGILSLGSYILQSSDSLAAWQDISAVEADRDNDTLLFQGAATPDGMQYFRASSLGK